MALLEVKNICKSFGTDIILENIMPGDIYIKARELHFNTEVSHVVLLIRIITKNDVSVFDVVSNLIHLGNIGLYNLVYCLLFFLRTLFYHKRIPYVICNHILAISTIPRLKLFLEIHIYPFYEDSINLFHLEIINTNNLLH